MGSLRYNLLRLLQFSGRSSLGQFWPYALAVLFLIVLGLYKLLDIVIDNLLRPRVPGGDIDHVLSLWPLIGGVTALSLVMILLLAASIVRRLHDADWSGWWAMAPLPFLATGTTIMAVMELDRAENRWLSYLFGYSALFYALAVAGLMTALAIRGNPGDNRYGPPPE